MSRLVLWLCIAGLAFTAYAADGTPPASVLETEVRNYYQAGSGIATSGRLTWENLEELQQKGIERVIDLRHPEEGIASETKWSQAVGVEYLNLPLARGSLPDEALIQEVSALLDQAEETPTLLHCGSGHRAGIVLAIYLHRQGATIDAALEQAQAAGTRVRSLPALRERLAAAE